MKGAIALAECIADNSVLVRIDLRENDGIALAGLMALHMAMRVNTSITSLDLDQSCTHSKNNKVADHQGQFQSMYDEIQILCQQNRQNALKKLSVQSAASSSAPSDHEDVEKSKDEEEAEKMKLSEGGSKETGEESEVEKISDSPVAEASNSSEIQCAEEQLTLSIPKHWRRQKERDLKKFHRSASLTCTEMVEDLTERVKQMHSSTGSLEDSVAASVATVKKPVVVENRPSISNISKCEWTRSPSLPDLPKSTENGTVTPVRRAGRRFSVSPSTSEAAFYSPPSRFKVQTVPSKPSTLTLSPTTGIPQLKVSPLAECPTGSSLTWHSGDAPRGLVILPSTSKAVVPSKVPKNEAKAPPKENDAQITECVKSVVNDLVNYCVYEVDGTTKDTSTVSTQVERSGSVGPSIKRATDSLERRKKTTPLNSSGPPPPVVESEVEATEVVQATVRHLVREVLRLERDEVAGKLQRKRNSMRRTNGVSPP
ncbi:hypothetical protein L596_027556 [Steinernema carpocapsae]|uniref:Uncharacterized protein n=1 Tax=Steinernema carpocapsae TaxID=34508 RepID=A0A4U5LVV0_STECR|nr:hypothetical protein L596_027556 [Steinernema carpocapsae]